MKITTIRECRNYWMKPNVKNTPDKYLLKICNQRTRLLIDLIKRITVNPRTSFMELGSNSGRNLKAIYDIGFRKLNAIEINPDAVTMFMKKFPEVSKCTKIHTSPIENIINNFKDNEFDITFSLATLQQVPYEFDWILPNIKRISRHTVITMEDEGCCRFAHFPRNYKDIFENMGMVQIYSKTCEKIAGLSKGFIARIFKHT